jgi:very-long-chain (3R)-3-hydroxyacyl-CoA dehydratase
MFFVLYPLGISSEMWLVYSSIPTASKLNPLYGYVLWAILGIYIPGENPFRVHRLLKPKRRICKRALIGFAPLRLIVRALGSYVLYTHMMAQRRRIMRGKQRARD